MIRIKIIGIIIPFIIIVTTFSLLCYSQTDFILKGAGATFPFPLYEEWIKIYEKQTGVRISYQAVGSGNGIKSLREHQNDFGATDAFLSDNEIVEMKADVLHIPTCLGAVVIIYNLPNKPELRLTSELLCDIFLGKITHWSDTRIAQVNPNLKLPHLKITVVHRSESSGTTFIFTNYLTTVCRQWQETVGAGKLVRWPTGAGIETNPGAASLVKKIEGAIGYVELNFAIQFDLPTALLQNQSGNFIKPDMTSISISASIDLPEDTRTLIIDTSASQGYPISAFTWLIFYKEQHYNGRDLKCAQALTKFLWWIIHEGQKYNNKMDYGSLSSQAIHKAENIIRRMTFDGKPLMDQ